MLHPSNPPTHNFYSLFTNFLLIFLLGFNITTYGVRLNKESPTVLDTNRVKSLNRLALLSYGNHINDMRTYADASYDMATILHFNTGLAESNRILGKYYLSENPKPLALKYLLEALTLFQEQNDKMGQMMVLEDMASYYAHFKELEQSILHLREASDINDLVNNPIEKAKIWQIFGEVYIQQKDYKKAESVLHSGLIAAQLNQDYTLFYFINITEASLYFSQNKVSEAIARLNLSLEFFTKENNVLGQYYSNLSLGTIYRHQKELEKARAYFSTCMQLSYLYGSKYFLSLSNSHLGTLDSIQRDYKQAFGHFSQFMKLKNSLDLAEISREGHLLETHYRDVKDEKLSLILKNANSRKAMVRQFWWLLVLLLIIVILAFCLLRYRQLNQRSRQSLTVAIQHNQEMGKRNNSLDQQRIHQEKINLVKDKLFSVISHDMRTPLTQLQGILALMEVNAIKVDEWKDMLPSLKRNVQTSTEQLDTLLIWSKNQMQGFNVNPIQFHISALIEQNYQLLKPSFIEKNLKFSNTISPSLMVEADQEMIQIVVRNLFTNAIKFTGVGGEIILSNTANENYAFIHVKDTGIGIKELDIPKIFEENDSFTRGTLGEKGTGLGLKLSRDFLVMNRGEIEVISSEGQGSTFTFSIPIVHEKKYNFSSEIL